MKRVLLCAISLVILVAGCSNSSDPVAPVDFAGGADLLGLSSAHELRYVIHDSTVVYFPIYSVDVDTLEVTLQITPGAVNTVELSLDNVAHDLLTVDNIGVLHSGQIRPDETPEDTLFFISTPVILPQNLVIGDTRTITTPSFINNGESERLALFFINYGYTNYRTFHGLTEVIVPISSYNAYHFQSVLFLDDSATDTVMVSDEYYAPGVGLVRMETRAAGTTRSITLLENN